jgi:hypothetical protein
MFPTAAAVQIGLTLGTPTCKRRIELTLSAKTVLAVTRRPCPPAAAAMAGSSGIAVDASVIKADANRSRSTAREGAEALGDPQHATRAVREYLAALDKQAAPVTVPASISPTDPGARWTAVDGPAFYAYSTNHLVDVQAGIIVDVEATPTLRTAEVKATRTMIERVEKRFDLKPGRVIGDMAYGNAELLGWMVNDKGIEPHVPVWDKTQRDDGTLSSSDFVG